MEIGGRVLDCKYESRPMNEEISFWVCLLSESRYGFELNWGRCYMDEKVEVHHTAT